jgi:hypothetical protein
MRLRPSDGGGRPILLVGRLPVRSQELNVFCDQCRFDFHTMEGNPSCEDPMACEQGAPARSHVDNYRQWQTERTGAAG